LFRLLVCLFCLFCSISFVSFRLVFICLG
jgi:hypothetical protein